LPGVGPALAAAIIEYRTEHGPFTSVEQLQEVPGIGERRLAQLSELVTAGPG
jgi:competence protein ComEA